MGIDLFQVTLNTAPYHVYRPGDIVTGNVRLNASSDVDLSEGLTVTLYGFAYVEWNESNGKTTYTYSGRDELFENSLVHSCSSHQTDYPFSMQIPNNLTLPWSIVTQHGRVEYGVRGVIKRPWYKLGNKKTSVLVTVNSHLNSRIAGSSKNSEYFFNRVTNNSDETNAGFCCIPFCCWYLLSREKIKMTLTTASLWAYPGEEVSFTLEVDNTKTGKLLGNAKVQLIGTWTHYGNCPFLFGKGTAQEKTNETVVHEEIIHMSVPPGDQVVTKGTFKVPMDVLPTQADCSVLKLVYKLRGVMDEISGFTCIRVPATVEIDILMGTLGADESLMLT